MSAALVPFLMIQAAQPALAQQMQSGADHSAVEEFKPDPNEQFVPAKLDPDGKLIVDGLNQFGLELYGKLRSKKGDLAISPASVSTAFGLAYAGARGRTAEEIAATLHYPAVGDLHGSFGGLLRTMDLHRNGRTLTVNNAIWLQDGMPVHPQYLALVGQNYGAGLQRVAFQQDPNVARQRINGWVESKTNNRIRNLLQPQDVQQDTRSVLVNTIYFKADWDDPFDEKDTREEDFKLASGATTKRKLMYEQGEFTYAEGSGLKVLAMPYRGSETEMLVFLPDNANGLSELESSLDSVSMTQWLAKLAEGGRPRVNVSIPKFKIEARFELAPALMELGMRIPLSAAADFSGMRPEIAPHSNQENWNLAIGGVVHQVFVEVEEKGTEAAAATAIGIVVTSARLPPPKPKEFRADHPFLFFIRDRRTDAILFVGRFTGE